MIKTLKFKDVKEEEVTELFTLLNKKKNFRLTLAELE